MTHFELVQAATDLLSETMEPMRWLASYDSALASSSDRDIESFVYQLRQDVRSSSRMAA
jgi:hypothetical protein